MEKQVGLWNSSMLDRPKRKSKRSKRRRYHSSSYHKYKKEETPREVSAAGKNGAALDSQVLFIDANYKKDVRLGIEIDDEEDDLQGDPYRAFTYNQLIDLVQYVVEKVGKIETV